MSPSSEMGGDALTARPAKKAAQQPGDQADASDRVAWDQLQALAPASPEFAIAWQAKAAIRCAPVWNGRQMVVASMDGRVQGVASDTAAGWAADVGQPVVGVSASADGSVRVVTSAGRLLALASDGRRLWSVELGASAGAPATVSAEGTSYVLADGLHAIDGEGLALWQLPRVGAHRAGPLALGELLVFGTEHGELVAVDRDGQERWTLAVGSSVVAAPTTAPRGGILVGTELGILHSVSIDGEIRWSTELEGRIAAPASTFRDGQIAVATHNHKLNMLNREGALLWQASLGSPLVAPPVFDSRGAILIGTRGNHLYLITHKGQSLWQVNVGHPIGTAVVQDPNGQLYVATDGGSLLTLRNRDSK